MSIVSALETLTSNYQETIGNSLLFAAVSHFASHPVTSAQFLLGINLCKQPMELSAHV